MNSRKKPITNYESWPIRRFPPSQQASWWTGADTPVRGAEGPRGQGFKFFNSKLNTQNSTLHSRGFTLIELIIFIIIAGMFLPATFVAFSASMKQATTPEDYTRGMLLAEETMELATKRGYAQLLADVSNVPSCGNPTGSTGIGAVVPVGYTCTFTPSVITTLTGGAGNLTLSTNNYVQISVSITTPQNNTFTSTGMVTNHGF